MASPMTCRVAMACPIWAWVRAPEKATEAWEASSHPASSLASVNAPGLRE